MSAIKHLMETIYYDHVDNNISVEDLSEKYKMSQNFVRTAIEFMTDVIMEEDLRMADAENSIREYPDSEDF